MTLEEFIVLADTFGKYEFTTLSLRDAFKYEIEAIAKWHPNRLESIRGLSSTLASRTTDAILKEALGKVEAKCAKALTMSETSKKTKKAKKTDETRSFWGKDEDEENYDAS